MKFLLVDDHSVVREGLRKILLAHFPQSTIMDTAHAEGLQDLLANNSFDLVISDFSLPGRSGLDVIKQVKAIHPKLPVLILSMHPEEQYAIRVLKAGGSGFISKTSGTEELIAAINRVLLGRKYLSAALAEQMADKMFETSSASHESLSDREFHVFKMIAEGVSLSEIANQLNLSLSTVSTHRAHILKKMNMQTNSDLIKYAIEHKIIK